MQTPVSDLRRNYAQCELHREDLAADPIEQFRTWFEEARAADALEPNACALSTADRSGEVTTRMVLLKAFDARGFVFFTNYGSRKAADLAENARCALLFPWLSLERQVVIRGSAAKISHAESLAYFLSRPLGNRVGAWISQQSHVVSSRALLKQKFAQMMEKFRHGEVPLPDFWGGYRVEPSHIEFWQGGENRIHDRFLYTRQTDTSWLIERLQP